MQKTLGACLMLVAALSGCVTTDQDPGMGMSGGASGCPGHNGSYAQEVPGMQGPYGEPVTQAAQYSKMSAGEYAAHAMMANSGIPLDVVQAASGKSPIVQAGATPAAGGCGVMLASAATSPGDGSGLMQAGGFGPPGGPGCPPGGCPPGGMPGPGCGPSMVPGAVAAIGALTGGVGGPRFGSQRTSVRFASPAGMKVAWIAPKSDGKIGFSATQIEAPGRYNFLQCATYRLKLSDIPNRPGLDLYPTLEVVPANLKTYPFLAHSAVPVAFTDEDFDQVAAGNFVVKVIYLPDPQFQDIAAAVEELVSTRLEPGVDPIAEAHRRGSILLILRLGNIDLEAPNTPAMDAPSPLAQGPTGPPMGGPGMPGPGMMPGMPGMGGMMVPNGGGRPMNPMAQGNPMMTPNGQMMMTPNGPVMMTPNGPMMIGPNGPVPMMPPNRMNPPGTLTGNPGMLPNVMPPAGPPQPSGPQPIPTLPNLDGKQGNAAPAGNGSGVVQTSASTPAALAAAGTASKTDDTTADAKKTVTRHPWWWVPKTTTE